MPPVVAAVTALVATYGVGTVIAVGMAVVAAGMSYAAYKEAKKAASQGRSASSQKQMFRSAAAPKQIVLGHAVTSGPMFFAAEEGSPNDSGVGETLHILIHIAGHPCEDITHCWMNDEELQVIATEDLNERAFKHKNGNGSVYVYLGEQTTQLPHLKGLPDADGKMIGHGDTIAHVIMKSDPEKWPAGIPNVKFAVKGAKVYDPRTQETAWTNNPALLLRWYRTVLKHGNPIDDSYIIAANICDELVETPTDDLEKRYLCNYAFPCDESPRTVMSNIRATCAGRSLSLIGRHAMTVGAYYGGATTTLNPSDIVGDLKTQADVRRRDRINTVTATYLDPESNWNEVDMPQFRHDGYYDLDGHEIVDDLNLECCPSPYQAQRLASIHLKSIREGVSVDIPCNMRGFELLPGTTFKLDFPENGWKDVEFMVDDWKFGHEKGVTLSCKQHIASNYEFNGSTAKVPTRPAPPTLHNPSKVEPISKLTYRELVDDNTAQALIVWEHRSYGGITYDVKIFQDGRLLRNELVKQKQYRLTDGFTVGSYVVEVVAINGYNATSPKATLVFETRAPVTPVDCTVEAGNWSVTMMPVAGAQTNYDTLFDFAFGFDEGETDYSHFIKGRGRSLTVQNLAPKTAYHFAVREVSRWGESGWLKGKATTSNNPKEVLEVIDGQIDHKHLNDNLNDYLSGIEERSNALVDDQKNKINDMFDAIEDFNKQEGNVKQQIGLTYAEKSITQHASDISAQAVKIEEMGAAVKDGDETTLALAKEYTRTSVGYCIDKDGNITEHDDAVLCVAAGHTWDDGPLATFIRNIAVETGDGQHASVSQLAEAFVTEEGKAIAKGGLTTNVNGHVSGMVNTNDGKESQLDFIAEHMRWGVLDEDGNFTSLFYLNPKTRKAVIEGQLILDDGHTVTRLEDISGTDGSDGDTIYTEFQFSATGNDWHFPDQPADRFMRSRLVTNNNAGAWGQATDLKGDPGQNATERYAWVKYANDSAGSGMSDDSSGKLYIGFAYNQTTPTESTNASDYTWSLFKGTDGNDGDTIYTEFQFRATGSDWHFPDQPADRFMRSRLVTNNNAGAWGQATDLKGDPGQNATERYTWVKYANDSAGSGMSDDSNGKLYIGFAYNKTTSTESTNASDYTWSLFKGTDGNNGIDGTIWGTLILRGGVFPSDTLANQDFKARYNRWPRLDDLLTYVSSDGNHSEVKSYDGDKWVAAQLKFNGNLITPGTVYGEAFVAGSVIKAPVIEAGTGSFSGAVEAKEGSFVEKLEIGSAGGYKVYIKSVSNAGHNVITVENSLGEVVYALQGNGNIYSVGGGFLNNLTIGEDCRVLGKITAEQIIGDVGSGAILALDQNKIFSVYDEWSSWVTFGVQSGENNLNRVAHLVINAFNCIHELEGGSTGSGGGVIRSELEIKVKNGETTLYSTANTASRAGSFTVTVPSISIELQEADIFEISLEARIRHSAQGAWAKGMFQAGQFLSLALLPKGAAFK